MAHGRQRPAIVRPLRWSAARGTLVPQEFHDHICRNGQLDGELNAAGGLSSASSRSDARGCPTVRRQSIGGSNEKRTRSSWNDYARGEPDPDRQRGSNGSRLLISKNLKWLRSSRSPTRRRYLNRSDSLVLIRGGPRGPAANGYDTRDVNVSVSTFT